MKLQLFLLISFCCVLRILTQPNCVASSCNACVKADGCGWCAPTQQCLPGTASGPNDGYCLGDAWQWTTCVNCSALPDCRSCLDYSTDCFFCNSTQLCHQIGTIFGCPYVRSCPCHTYPACSACVYESRGECQWCPTDSTCRRIYEPSGCNLVSQCPCAQNPDCNSCKETSGCFWCLKDGTCRKTSDSGNCSIPYGGCDAYCKQAGGAGCTVCNSLRGCVWCPEEGECRDVDFATCKSTFNCPVNCQPYTSCSSCLKTRGCAWCSDSSTCTNIDGSTCTLAASCTQPVASDGFSGSSFVGGMFLVIGILCLVLLGFFIYRWKVNKTGTYTELK
jgi:hypothetical protein